jgi:hypothetical protein
MKIIKPGVVPDEVKYRIPDDELLYIGKCYQCGCVFEVNRSMCRWLPHPNLPETIIVTACPTEGCGVKIVEVYPIPDQPTHTNGFVPKPEPKRRSLFQRLFNRR